MSAEKAAQHLSVMDDAASREMAHVQAPSSETAAILSVIERAAQNPNVDIDKMERLFEMRERALNRTAREAYDTAFALMQVELPTIDQNGAIVIEKNNVVQQRTPFAKFEDINDAIKPVLVKHGFGLSFRTGVTAEGRITVMGILSHKGGHREETTMILPHDSTGSKNAVQAIGSSTSYGRRYTTLALLNITSRARQDRDDDGQVSVGPDLVSDDQIKKLRAALEFKNGDEAKFCRFAKVSSLADLPSGKFEDMLRIIQSTEARK